jgi:hypothetical protein
MKSYAVETINFRAAYGEPEPSENVVRRSLLWRTDRGEDDARELSRAWARRQGFARQDIVSVRELVG